MHNSLFSFEETITVQCFSFVFVISRHFQPHVFPVALHSQFGSYGVWDQGCNQSSILYLQTAIKTTGALVVVHDWPYDFFFF